MTNKKIIRILERSKRKKIKEGYSRKIGTGFIVDDILSVEGDMGGLFYKFSWGNQTIPVQELNLRETEETIKFLKRRRRN